MDYNQYENYGFDRISAFNLATGIKDRSHHAHWHPFGETKKIRMAWYEYSLRFCEKKEYLTHTEHLMIVSKKD